MKNKKKYATAEDLLIPRLITEDLIVNVGRYGESCLLRLVKMLKIAHNKDQVRKRLGLMKISYEHGETGKQHYFELDNICSWNRSRISTVEPKKQYTVELTSEQLLAMNALGVVVNEVQDDE